MDVQLTVLIHTKIKYYYQETRIIIFGINNELTKMNNNNMIINNHEQY